MRGLIDKLPRDRIELILILPAQVCTYVEIVTDYVLFNFNPKRSQMRSLNSWQLMPTVSSGFPIYCPRHARFVCQFGNVFTCS